MYNIGIIGHGHVGSLLGQHLHGAGYKIFATKTEILKDNGSYPIESCRLPKDIIHLKKILSDGVLIFLIPPSTKSYRAIIDSLIKYFPATQKLIFFSSTSVYGDKQGLCNEATIPYPTSKNGQELLICEGKLKNHFQYLKIIRPSGIVDELRNPIHFFKNTSEITNSNFLINLIHTQDIIIYIEYLIKNYASSKSIKNLVSEDNMTKDEFYNGLRRFYHLPKLKTSENHPNPSKKILSQNPGPCLNFPNLFEYFKGIKNV
ncbi:MAG: hypothetical protein H6622_10005 [Halobacteriovoraceae bacterium]|nr:hypothetical protein [Halobacteriovoraceae bacterium]